MPRVFISHSSLDRELVEREIISPLRAHGVETWYSTDSIKSASEWERQIRVGLNESDWFLIALSPHSVTSEWVRREVHWAFLKRKERIVPVMLETCEPDELHLGLLPLQFIDFRNGVAEAQDRLLAVWGLDKATQVETRHHAAQGALAREDWSTAVEHLEAVLRLDPAHSTAEAELNHARQHQGLAALYDAGLAHLREERWHDALAALRQVQGIDGNYKDVADSIALADAELQKEEAERLYREALGAAGREEWDAAVGQLEAALKLNPSHAEAQAALSRAGQRRELAELYREGRGHLQSGRWRDALKSFRRVRAIDKGYGGVADLIAEADAGLEDEEVRRAERERQEREAEEEAERQARERQAQQAREQLYREALDAVGREDWDAAREKLQAVAAADPGNDEIAARLAEVGRQHLATVFDEGMQHLKDGRWVKALHAFLQVQEADGDYKDVSAQIARAETELKSLQENLERELQEQERQRQQAGEETERRHQAEAEARRKGFEFEAGRDVGLTPDADSAGRNLVKDLAVPVGGVVLLVSLALILWPKEGPSPRGISNAAAAQQPATAADFYNRAEAFRKQDNYAEAEAEYRKAVALEPDNADYYDGFGNALYYQGKHKEAEAMHRKATDLDPGKADYQFHLGHDLYRQGEINRGKHKEAEAAYRKATDLDPYKADYHFWLAGALHAQDKYKEAEAAYRKAIDLDPDDSDDYVYHLFLAQALRLQNKYAEAGAVERKADELKSKSP